ncbi:hypothetical protein [Paenibacillus tyrfis]|uniref:Uncharacterized protein n=1 Tax=Paenibacillus tyrfis TaxID=1501230 RepID=A0A081NVL7_9BACL|nr:hypothetical protein [Paenibacillus tyrfis]KEQ22490.1 hypothetical protein ET33_22980 [Paenibacillus tyrfis]
MFKKNIVLLSIVIVLLLISASVIYEQQRDKNIKIESLVGYSLTTILNSYDKILDSKTDNLSIEYIIDLNRKLAQIEAYSDILDRAVGRSSIQPIVKSMLIITENMENSYKKNKNSFTQSDNEKYLTLVKEISNLIPLMYKTYYVPGSTEGGKVRLEVVEQQGIIEIRDRLNQYMTK